MATTASESDLEVVRMADDQARRWRIAALLGICLFAGVVVAFEGGFETRSNLLALVVLLPGLVIAWRAGAMRRAFAFAQLGRIRAEGLAATKLLSQGDYEGARGAYARLLVTARPFAAFHSVHVFMYGVTSFYLGNTREAVKLARRVLDSDWLKHPRMRGHRNLAETWSILIFLEAGQLEEAKRLLSSRSDSSVSTGKIAVALCEERWDDALSEAKRALAASDVLKESRPTIAALGLFAAKKLGQADDERVFEEVLAAQPLGKLARENPALTRFL
ncbi:MAG: hypothetical protein HOV80_24730 [Polyangiaceae bacterium]|nr:hypothetical protein [Polyangiaceae bacterium]